MAVLIFNICFSILMIAGTILLTTFALSTSKEFLEDMGLMKNKNK